MDICTTDSPLLEVHNLIVHYGKKTILYGIDLSIGFGKIVGIMGPNGAGKSTFIKAITGAVKPTSGWIKLFNQPHIHSLKRVAYVPQRESIDWDFPINVYEVVMMGRYGEMGWFKWPSHNDHTLVEESLKSVDMLAFKKCPIGQLSGGQQQRVFIARALAQEADLYLMDEPFTGIDATTEKTILNVFQNLKLKNKTIIVVHHDLATAKQYFDELVLLNLRLIAHGKMETVFTPHWLQKTYGGRLNILSEVTKAMDDSGITDI